ncbi:hypothetical protein DFH09DRAFT_1458490 [Mycena vulgaris]|nr:hypothetical protein DFH09DRAFT_1458490 [Mycena vulgaris]
MDRLQSFECGTRVTADPDEDEEVPITLTSTRHRELLNTNEPPLDSEYPFIQSLVSQIRRRLSRHGDKISVLRAELEQLEKEHTSLENDLARNTAILSPARRMPHELLSEIFVLALPSREDALESNRFDADDAPWTLGRVCGQWRLVALSSPSLWSLVVINYDDIVGSPSTAYPLSMLETQLERARSLQVYFTPVTVESSHQNAVLLLLVNHSRRWERLALLLTPGIQPIIATLRDRIPLLRKLRIEWNNPNLEDDSDDETDTPQFKDLECFRVAPALRDASLVIEDRALSVPLPAHQLTRYELNGPWHMHVDILKLATNLVEARIFVADAEVMLSRVIPEGVIELRDLRRLYVSDADILDSLRLPALEELGFYHENSGDDDLRHVKSLLQRSSCNLRRLCVMGIPFVEIVDVLQNNKSIVELTIILSEPESPAEANLLILTLCQVDANDIPSIAPQLTAIFVACEDATVIDHTLYHDMLLSRWKPGSFALTSAALLTVSEGSQPSSDILLRLDSLRRDGLDLLLLEGHAALRVMNEWVFSKL